MGKFEVLGWLGQQRMSGNNKYYTYTEVHQQMRREGLSNSYVSVWRSINDLWSDGLLEHTSEGTIVQRTVRFRAKKQPVVQSSDMKRVHNIPRKQEQESGRITSKRRSYG